MLQRPHALVDSAAAHGRSELERLDYLDGWRGIAIALVLQAHFAGTRLFYSGAAGVDVFFCLSGLLMANLLFVRRVPLGEFYRRRISRIIPVFLLFVVCAYALAILQSVEFTGTEVAATLTFLRTYLPAAPGIWDTHVSIQHLWSLNVEEHSYIFLGFVTLLPWLQRREGWPLIATGLVAILMAVFYVELPDVAPHSGELGTEVNGGNILLAAGYCLVRKRFVRFVRPWMPLAAFAFAMICYTNLLPWWSNMLLAPPLLAFSVNHMSEAPARVRELLALPLLRLLGIWSYSIYVWQQPFYLSRHALPPGVAFTLALAAGLLSFYLFENPVRAWLNRKMA